MQHLDPGLFADRFQVLKGYILVFTYQFSWSINNRRAMKYIYNELSWPINILFMVISDDPGSSIFKVNSFKKTSKRSLISIYQSKKKLIKKVENKFIWWKMHLTLNISSNVETPTFFNCNCRRLRERHLWSRPVFVSCLIKKENNT